MKWLPFDLLVFNSVQLVVMKYLPLGKMSEKSDDLSMISGG